MVGLVVFGKDVLLAAVIVSSSATLAVRLRRSVAFLTVMSRNIHRVSPKRNALGEFQGPSRV